MLVVNETDSLLLFTTDNCPRTTDIRLKPLGNHNRSWIWGRHAVGTTLAAGFWTPLEVAVSDRCPMDLRSAAERSGVPVAVVTEGELARRCRADDHQGIAARMPEFPYTDLDELFDRTAVPTAWLVLDGIQDSFNVGAIVRSAVELGIEAILLGTVGQSGVNSQVVRSSAGAVNYIPIARAADLASGVRRLTDHGITALVASEKSSRLLDCVDLTRPVAIVIGNEARGVSEAVMALCAEQICIPIGNRVGSLNAAVAAGILCYELTRQRKGESRKSEVGGRK